MFVCFRVDASFMNDLLPECVCNSLYCLPECVNMAKLM